MIERCKVGAFSVAGAPIAGPDGIGKEWCLERRAHERFAGIWQIGDAGGRVGVDVAVAEALSSYLLFHFRFDGIECQVFPAMLGLELG